MVNAGTLAPGNSIGTLNVNGTYTQAAGSTYQVEVNAAGQADRINVTGNATINGGTVQVLAQPGTTAAARPTPSSPPRAASPAPTRASPATSPS